MTDYTKLIEQLRDNTARHDDESRRLCNEAAEAIEALQAKLDAITKEAETNQKWAFLEWRDKAERLQSQLDAMGKGEPVADQALQVARLHFGHAKGHYMGMCSRCNERMDMVDKRCRVCVDCADKAITAHGIGGTP